MAAALRLLTRNLTNIAATRNNKFLSQRWITSNLVFRHEFHGRQTRPLSLCSPCDRACNDVTSSLLTQHCHLHTTMRCRAAESERVVVTPQFADSISEGDIRWEKAVGDIVGEDDVVAEIETDKTSIPITAPFVGVIAERYVDDGATVQPGAKLFKITRSDASSKTDKPVTATPSAGPAPKSATPAQPTSQQRPEAPLPPPPPIPSAPITSKPVASIKPIAVTSQASTPSRDFDPASKISGTRTEQRVKMNRMRQRISQRLKDAQNTNAMLTTFNEIDMSNVMDLRKKHQDAFVKKHNMKLGFMSAFVRATVYALLDQPVVNAVIDGQDIVYRDFVDISVAVASPKGLVVPVIRNAERMNYADIEKSIAALGEKARSGTLAIEDMDGGTFTISNGGVFGSLYGTPIINPPQSAILGMHAIFDRPVAIAGKVEIRPMMYVALTYDHRLIDGREGVLFLRKIKSAVEDPRVLLLDI